MSARIDVLLDEPQARISPNLYGYLLENLGTVIYDGVWVGEGSAIPNIGGIRKELIERMRELRASVIRWPGGNFADHYDWRDGIGPRDQRPRRTNMWSNAMPVEAPAGPQRYDPNHFGTHEFMNLCRLSGGRPFLSANVRSLEPQAFTQWVEYCNSPEGSTTLADARKANGSAEPFNVDYWTIGNEVWAAGGNMEVADYAALYKRFVIILPRHGRALRLVACGSPPPTHHVGWVRDFLRICKRALLPVTISAISIHYYYSHILEEMHPGETFEQYFSSDCDRPKKEFDAIKFGEDEWYEMLARASKMNQIIEAYWEAIHEFDPDRKMRLSIDEWGALYDYDTKLSPLNIHDRASTLRDALAAAITLDVLQSHPDKVEVANFTGLVNQEGGLFRAEGENFVANPVFHVFRMYAAHQGAQAIPTLFTAPKIRYNNRHGRATLWGLKGSASRKGDVLTLTVVNPHATLPCNGEVRFRGGAAAALEAETLTHRDICAQNTFDAPENVATTRATREVEGESFTYEFPPASVSRLSVLLR